MRKLKMGLLLSAMMVAVAAVGAEKFISFDARKGYIPWIWRRIFRPFVAKGRG